MVEYFEKTITLMFGNNVVFKFNFRDGFYETVDTKYMPYGLRGKFSKMPEIHDGMSKVEIVNYNSLAYENEMAVRKWFIGRTLSLSRANAKKLFNLLEFPQIENEYNKFDMVITCRAVSVLDEYWIRFDGEENLKWESIDIRKNSLNEIIAQVALHGDALTFQGSYNTPEITTNGVYAKAWRQHGENLWLHKLSFGGGCQSEIEVSVSNILDKCNVDHVHYESGIDNGEYVCMCPCMADDKNSIISAYEYKQYCGKNGLDFKEEIIRIDACRYYKMHIVNYLICNHDRHDHNWGLFIDNSSFEIKSLHPLFDHNNAFDSRLIPNDINARNTLYLNVKSKAEFAMSEVDFHFTALILESDFVKREHYEAFMRHAEILGIKTVSEPNPFENAVNRMSG